MLRARGPFDVVHCHCAFWSGRIVHYAAQAGVPVRIVHGRDDLTESFRRESASRRRAMIRLRESIRENATDRWAVSRRAGTSLFGEGWCGRGGRIVPSAVDFAPFAELVDSQACRAEFQLPSQGLVLGHVGRSTEKKNQTFLIDVLGRIIARRHDAWLMLIGDGPNQYRVQKKVHALGLGERVRWAGDRTDVARLLIGAVDVFVFPSQYEGLGRAALEAQAAGLPTLVSEGVPEAVDVIPELIRRLPLLVGADAWADAIIDAAETPRLLRREALKRMRQSPFSIDKQADDLVRFYAKAIQANALGEDR